MAAPERCSPISQWRVLQSSPRRRRGRPARRPPQRVAPTSFSDTAPLRWEERLACWCEQTATRVFTDVCTHFSRLLRGSQRRSLGRVCLGALLDLGAPTCAVLADPGALRPLIA